MDDQQQPTQPTPEQKERALQRLNALQPLLAGAARGIIYLTAGVTAYCLLPDNPASIAIPAALAPLIETLGANLLANVVQKVADGRDLSNKALLALLQAEAEKLTATQQRQLANVTTRRDLYRAVSTLAEQADSHQQQLIANQGEMLAALAQLLAARPADRLFHGVPDMPINFLGRTALVDDLAARLTGGETLALAAEGLPGVGKTALAVALAHDERVLAHFADGVLWAGLGKEGDVLSALSGWAAALGGDVSQLGSAAARRQAVKDMIGQRRLLLVIDDAWDPEAAQALRCGGPRCVHLLTTRLKDVAWRFAGREQAAFVPELDADPALALLQTQAPQAVAADPEMAKTLVQAVGGLPLALELLGSYLGAPRRSATATLSQNALQTMAAAGARLALACRRLGDLHGREVTLRETILLSLAGLEAEEGGAEAVAAFHALGAMAPKPATFTWDAAAAVAACDEETLAWLWARNLVELVDADAGRLALHQALADAARTALPAAAAGRHRDYYLALANEDGGDWQRIERHYAQISWAWDQAVASAGADAGLAQFVWALWRYQFLRGLIPDYLDWAQTALAAARKSQDFEKIASMLTHLGFISRFVGQPQEALRFYNEALPIRRQVGDRAGEANTLNNIGAVYDGLGQPQEALRFYNEALPIRRQVGDRAGEANTLNNIGAVYRGLGQPQEALRFYNEALPILRQVGDRAGEAATLNNIGAVYRVLGQPQEALRFYNEALPIRRQVGDRAGEATTLTNIGGVYVGLGQPQEALRFYNEALPIRRQVGDRAGEATTLNNIGLVYDGLGQPQEALRFYNEALPILRQVGDRAGEATTLNNIGLVYDGLGQPQEALRFYNEALPILRQVGDRAGEAATLNNIGGVYVGLGQPQEALRFYNEALPITRQVGDRAGEAATLNNIGFVYRVLGQPQEALRFYNEALPIRRQVGHKYGESITRYNIAMVLRGQGKLAEAVAHLRRVVALDAEIQHPDLESDRAMLARLEAELAAGEE